MPSFFFHLAFDLDRRPTSEESTITHDSREACAGNGKELEDSKNIGSPDSKYPSFHLESDCVSSPTLPTSNVFSHDWRFDKISTHTISMAPSVPPEKGESKTDKLGNITNGISAGTGGLATKGRYEPLDPQNDELGWGVVRLYRDAEETPGLYDESVTTKHVKSSRSLSKKDLGATPKFADEDCTTLCILAVPSYLTPSDFLGFVGEKTRDEVSYFRMIRTERSNRYMVLMKFRSGKRAREWRSMWNGKAFDGMEVRIFHFLVRYRNNADSIQPENCHVVFVKSIEFRTNDLPGQEASFPDMTNDPFTPSINKTSPLPSTTTVQPSTSRSTKPMAPPTPSLVELPTCPVCLERMDESTGLLTILCQHVFHCSCLQKWRGSGCPVCRYTQDDALSNGKRNNPSYTSEAISNECRVCHSEDNLWICLICGTVGCGRYDAAHAFAHFEETGHCFAMDMTTQRVWDYASDGYVHRILQNKTDGKLVELSPTTGTNTDSGGGGGIGRNDDDDFDDYVPREKMDNIGLEYTHLLTSQLDSQRMYFEEILERAADKASQATLAAEKAAEATSTLQAQFESLSARCHKLETEIIPTLERDSEREKRKASKYVDMARKLEREWRDEKAMNGSLVERVKMLTGQNEGLAGEKKELEETVRDLQFFITGQAKLRELDGGEGEVEGGVVSLPDEGEKEKGKGKKKKGGKR